ncbi:EscV/YscV/HrcV family type III secretion system export apparatus protein [Pseudomonas daroniae]|uniref:EscV/YscV/HrcV family type III secretion system export apparatus protein n=1 Tax=Phytopseudomonas daroniae TaxID=2487519 RepID=A0A4Q9QT33_9GAMM|nr:MULTISPECIES: type III secretion system export apparatus subunit SctV [Pseudomonas]TBU78940.1 EscV/YscV/HrcV family type III secretion system export apparatus protein [Pseudomonas daroniae]TBU83149.1 EscV/YscV/HrcV family type III secretion system export apparatus protein [Pseudomonas sp. FRB 228]TBU83837.1 EscV/YscV/HrcV family type III secretion system export apparatus protein [Pseudomonas daroniae]TBU93014.1 EscV/YscV/HrcV family type III secretion system export apparatus protein [Pseudom
MMARLSALAGMAAQRTEVVIVAFMMMAIVMMIIPLPTYLVDTLIGISIALSILVLIVAFYISKPLELSALPALILLSTLFRLALSISTTRLILLHGDAGHIIEAFGKFVIAGEVVVGLVIFLIITVAQFVVITKGAERVAEVAARFSLDAMPGKQMSIDNDLRNGDIDSNEARRRRSDLQRESQLFGAMDGSMKFVKGDAIAGLVILFVNLIGGLLIGMLSRGMSFSEAGHTYSLLTVGDGLIAQIPALLIAVAAGTVVTRVNNEAEQSDLGTEIIRQMGNSQRALTLTALILAAVAFIPGFPAPVFLGLSAVLGLCAWMLRRRQRREQEVEASAPDVVEEAIEAEPENEAEPSPAAADSRVLLSIGPGLAEAVPLQPFKQRLEVLCHDLHNELGIEFPMPSVLVDMAAATGSYRVELEGVPVDQGELNPAQVLLQDDPVHLQLLDIQGEERASPLSSRPGLWIAGEQQADLSDAGIVYLRPDEILRDVMARTLRRYAGDFLGIQETRQLLAHLEESHGELVKEALRAVPLQRVADALRRLVAEGVSIRNRRALLEAMVEWGGREGDVGRFADHLRMALARQISHQHADEKRVIAAFVLGSALEAQLLEAARQQDTGRGEIRAREATRGLLKALRQQCAQLPEQVRPTLVVHPELRRRILRLCIRDELEMAVLSFTELAPEYSLQAIKVIGSPATARAERSEPAPALAGAT